MFANKYFTGIELFNYYYYYSIIIIMKIKKNQEMQEVGGDFKSHNP